MSETTSMSDNLIERQIMLRLDSITRYPLMHAAFCEAYVAQLTLLLELLGKTPGRSLYLMLPHVGNAATGLNMRLDNWYGHRIGDKARELAGLDKIDRPSLDQ